MTEKTTPATQALLPVTQEARDAAAGIAEDLAINSDMFAPLIRNGEHDRHPFVQAFAIFERDILERQAHSLPGDVGTDALRKALRPFANAAKWWKAFDNQHRITTLHQHGDCLEVGHLRAAEAALTPSAG